MRITQIFFNQFKNKFKQSLNDQSGQIAVVVFLIMAVLLVVGLSLATRTSQEIEQAGQAEDTTRVFNAAESGIEAALDETVTTFVYDGSTQGEPDIDSINNAEVDVSIATTDEFSPTVQAGQSVTVYTKATTGTVKISWGDPNISACSSHASIIVTAYIQDGGYRAEHYAYNPNASECPSNQFQAASPDTTGYKSSVAITIPNGTKFLRLKPLYNSTKFNVTGDIDTQAHIIRSQATDTTGTNKEVRTIEVTRTKPAPPSILDYALYSGGTLEKS